MHARLQPRVEERTRPRKPAPEPAVHLAGRDAVTIAALQSLAGNTTVARALEGRIQRNGVHDNPLYKDPGRGGDNPLHDPMGPGRQQPQGISKADADAAKGIADELTTEAEKGELEYAYHGLGGGGAGLTRSSEVKKFRKNVKTAARQQAYIDIGKETKGKPATATSEYQEMMGGNIAYKKAKKTVDQQLDLEKVTLVTSDFTPLWTAARKAAEASFAVKSGDRKAAVKAAKEAAKQPLEAIHARTRTNKDTVVGKRTGATDWQMTPEGQDVSDRVVNKVEQDKVGKKSLELGITAPTMNKALRLLGVVLDNAIAGAGETISLGIELTIPTGTGVAVVIGLKGVAARGLNGATTAGVTTLGKPQRLEIMAKFSLGVGADAIGLKSSGTVGVLVRSGSDAGTDAAMQALSYATYRAAKPEAFANLWAPEDKMGKASVQPRPARQRAEMWAAMVEEQIFSGGATAGTYGDVGISADATAGVNIADVAKLEASLGDTLFSRYNEESMKASLGSSFAAPVKSDLEAKSRREKASGAKKLALAFGVGAKFGAGGYSVDLALSASGTDLKNWGIEITAGIGTAAPGAAMAADVALNQLVSGVGELLKKTRDAFAKAVDDQPGTGGILTQIPADPAVLIDANNGNALQSAIEGIGATETSKAAFETPLGQTPATGADALETVSPLDLASSLQFAFIIGRDDGKWVGRIEVRSVRGIDVGGGSPVAVSASKTTRLFALGIEEGRVVAELAGGRLDGGA